MSATQLIRPCWIMDDDPGEYDGCHYDNAAEARRGPDGRFRRARRLPPCWVGYCHGPGCEEQLSSEEEGYLIHCVSRADVEAAAVAEGWVVTRDGALFCPPHIPAGLDPVVDLMVWHVPGQELLFGEAS